ncbi:class II histone deacetylase [Natrialbaceae archaeon GCM10025896]
MPWTDRLEAAEPHPDRRERIENIAAIIENELDDHTTWAGIEPATDSQLARVHDETYINTVRTWADNGGGRLTRETGGSKETYQAAAFAAGGAIAAVKRAVDSDRPEVPYALVRPSGHHAQPSQADGFCFFNNVAVAADHVLETNLADRVAILDWDVHHANGTQEVFYDRDDVLVISLHNDHWSWDDETHPQSCDLSERGAGDGTGYTVNIPLPAGTGDTGYRYAINELVDPVLSAFDPDALLVSAGQDPGTMDPLGRNTVTKAGFETLGSAARTLSNRYTDGTFAIVQEGGYHVTHLAYATLGVLEGALGIESEIADPFTWMPENVDLAKQAVDRALRTHSAYWPVE